MVNSVDPDQTPRSAASDLGLHCLPRSVCPKYGSQNETLGDRRTISKKCGTLFSRKTTNHCFEAQVKIIVFIVDLIEDDNYAVLNG